MRCIKKYKVAYQIIIVFIHLFICLQPKSGYSSQSSPTNEDNEVSNPAQSNAESLTETDTNQPTISGSLHQIHPWDVALFLSKELEMSITNAYKSIWSPPEKYKFPCSGERNLRFQGHWLKTYHWLAYSRKEDAAFCKACLLQCKKTAGVGSQPLKGLVNEPYRNWKKALDYFKKHESTVYHKSSMLALENIRKMDEGKMVPIDVQLSSEKKKVIEENKKKLMAIVETVKLCGQQGLALRGSKEGGQITPEVPAVNDGNFRPLLRFRATTDDLLKKHLETSSKNAVYTSNRIQNEVISIFHKKILRNLVDNINKSKAFSLLADETSDISGLEQLSICVRYTANEGEKCVVKEDFIGFVPVTDCTGKNLATTAVNFLQENGIDTCYLYGQGYDGAAAMSGKMHGTQAYIQADHPLALYVHCASHSLNLAVSSASNISAIRNCLGTIESVYNFFNSPKRQAILQETIAEVLPEANHSKLKKYCPTRWIERHQSVSIYCELQEGVIEALGKISQLREATVAAQAFQLLSAIKNCQFQICCQILLACHAILTPLSVSLQREDLHLTEAVLLAQHSLEELKNMRKSASEMFRNILEKAKSVMEDSDIALSVPRLSKKQQHRSNVEIESPEEYYRVTMFIPFLDELNSHIESRFIKHGEILSSFDCLLPQRQAHFNEDNCRTLYRTYESVLECINEDEFLAEIKMWRRRIGDCSGKKGDLIFHALDICEASEAFLSVRKLLKILTVLPVTTATAERSFSTLRRLKTYIRNSMSEERLNGLALLNIHREINVSSEEIVNEFANSNRKMLLC